VKLEHTKYYTKTLPAYTGSYTFLKFTHSNLRTTRCYLSPQGGEKKEKKRGGKKKGRRRRRRERGKKRERERVL